MIWSYWLAEAEDAGTLPMHPDIESAIDRCIFMLGTSDLPIEMFEPDQLIDEFEVMSLLFCANYAHFPGIGLMNLENVQNN